MENYWFYWRELISIVYVDDGIFSSPSDTTTDQAITEIGSKLEIEDKGDLDEYSGVKIENLTDRKI